MVFQEVDRGGALIFWGSRMILLKRYHDNLMSVTKKQDRWTIFSQDNIHKKSHFHPRNHHGDPEKLRKQEVGMYQYLLLTSMQKKSRHPKHAWNQVCLLNIMMFF